MRFSKPQECAVCKRVFLTQQDLISHLDAFHSNRHFSTFSSSAPTTFRHYPNLSRNPSPGFPVRNHFDLNYYRSGYLDDQGRFHKGFPPAPAITPAKKYNLLLAPKMPKLMDLFPATSSEGSRTLPLLCQLEQRRPENTVTENGGANSSSIDLSLRL